MIIVSTGYRLAHHPFLAALLALLGLVRSADVGGVEYVVTRADDPVAITCMAGDCSLRGAIVAANASPGADTIRLPAGDYELQRAGVGEDMAQTGDVDILDDLVIEGAGSVSTRLFPHDVDRLFDIARGVSVTLRGVSILNTVGVVSSAGWLGGGIRSGAFGAGDEAQTWLILSDVSLDSSRVLLTDGISARGHFVADRLRVTKTWTDILAAVTFTGTDFQLYRSELVQNAAVLRIDLVAGGTAVVRDTRIASAGAENSCGGIHVSGPGTALFERVSVEQTFSFGYAAVCVRWGSTATIRDSTFGDNSAPSLYVGGAPGITSVDVVNSTLSGNGGLPSVTVDGGGVLTLRHSTVGLESAQGTAIESFSGGTLKLINTIVAGRCSGAGTLQRDGVNIESPDNTCGLSAAVDHVSTPVATLALGPLQNNGGPTRTRMPGQGSIAIAASNSAGIAFCPQTDQRGYFRHAICDVGAVEVVSTSERIFAVGFGF